MAAAKMKGDRSANPIDLVERIAASHDWACDRSADDELTLVVTGTSADYHLSLNWRRDLEALHLACAFDFKAPAMRLGEIYRLIARINEQLWFGHFDLWADEGLVMYRHAVPLNGSLLAPSQCDAMLRAALEACEKYYQTFQFVVWAGKGSKEALASAMFETEGRA